MNEGESSMAGEVATESEIKALLDRVAAAMVAIEHAKRERSTEEMRAARMQIAALHGVARLRRQAERHQSAA